MSKLVQALALAPVPALKAAELAPFSHTGQRWSQDVLTGAAVAIFLSRTRSCSFSRQPASFARGSAKVGIPYPHLSFYSRADGLLWGHVEKN